MTRHAFYCDWCNLDRPQVERSECLHWAVCDECLTDRGCRECDADKRAEGR